MRLRKPFVVGEVFGRLTILQEIPPSGNQRRKMVCRCTCSKTLTVLASGLRTGNTRSCGCLRREMVAAKNYKHGARKRKAKDNPPEYVLWKRMRQRCNDSGNHEWDRYGGRGITVDPRWDDFTVFLADVGPRPTPNHSIDRIDNEKGYSKDNVRWATASQQARNKRNSRRVVFNGQSIGLADLAEAHGIPYGRLYTRLWKGWSVEKAVSTPTAAKGRRKRDGRDDGAEQDDCSGDAPAR
jgi:hypothetical protein